MSERNGTTTADPSPKSNDNSQLSETSLLEVDSLQKSFGGIRAVDDVSFEIRSGSIVGLIGPNGAGKSTTFDLITGVASPDAGSVYFQGRNITGRQPYRNVNQGLVRTFQLSRELDEMTVIENLILAPQDQTGEYFWQPVLPGTRKRVRSEERDLRERVWETLEFFELDHLADEYARNLSGGQRKLLELARALLTDPDILLLDEPLVGVNPTLERKLLGRIHDLNDRGYTFLLIEHDVDVIMENCERVIVMNQGQILADGSPAEVSDDQRVLEAYLGETV